MTREPLPPDTDDADEAVEVPPPRPWSARAQVLAAVLWPSFLAASLATMLFFALVDPALVHDSSVPEPEQTRMAVYGIMFFFFWLVTTISSAVSVYLIRTSHLAAEDEDSGQ